MGRPRSFRAFKARLTRAEVAERLGVSRYTVKRLEGVELFPLIDHDGTRWFDAGRVEELAMRCDSAECYGLEPNQRRRAQALCSELGMTLSAWVREQIEKRLLSD